MLKQPSPEYRGFRRAGIRLSEEMLPELGRLYASRTRPMLRVMHAFDKAHAVMLVEEGLLRREHGAAILTALRAMEKDGVEEVRLRVGGGLHSGEQYLIRALGEEIGGRLHLARSSGDLSSVGINTLQRDALLDVMDGGQPPAPGAARSGAPAHRYDPARLQLRPARPAHDAGPPLPVVGGEPGARLRPAARRLPARQRQRGGGGHHGGLRLRGEPRADRGAARLRRRARERRRRDPGADARRQPRRAHGAGPAVPHAQPSGPTTSSSGARASSPSSTSPTATAIPPAS